MVGDLFRRDEMIDEGERCYLNVDGR